MKITLKDGYFMEIDAMNYTLKKMYTGKRKGEECEAEKIIGYYKNLAFALDKFIELMHIEGRDSETVDIAEYVSQIRELDEKNLEFLKRLIKGSNVEKG